MTKRFVILGNSPNKYTDPNLIQLLKHSTVIGVNRAPLHFRPLDHWVVWDSHDMMYDHDMVGALSVLSGYPTKKWVRDTGMEIRLPLMGLSNMQWFDGLPQNSDPSQWRTDKLPCRGSVCTTAAALAYLLGATEIWLVGVDFATPGPTPDWTEEILTTVAKFVNEFFKDFPIPVYKTYDGGPLELEYRQYERP